MKFSIQNNEIFFTGVMDETFSRKDLLKQIENFTQKKGNQHLGLNFKDVSYANSSGISEWLRLLSELPDTPFYYSQAPVWLVKHFSTIQDFFKPLIYIQSFYIPFYCEKTDEELFELFQMGRDIPLNTPAAEIKIQSIVKGKSVFEVDVNERSYLHFLDLISTDMKNLFPEALRKTS